MTDVMSNSSSLKFLLQNFTVIKITLNDHILDVASTYNLGSQLPIFSDHSITVGRTVIVG